MLVFGCCIGPSGKFATVAGPSLESVMGPDDVLVREHGGDGICAAYNRILQQARDLDDCEGVVLLHDDVALGGDARGQLAEGLGTPGVGVVGAVGGRGLFGPQWVDARHCAGCADDYYGRRRFGPATADVDAVDGLLLALTPLAFQSIDFDEKAFPAFHGYDTDYCLLVRRAGLRVLVVPVDYVHRDKGGVGDPVAFQRSADTLRARWPDRIVPLSISGRGWLALRRQIRAEGGRVRHLAASRLKNLRRQP